jgi:hypothetical protein
MTFFWWPSQLRAPRQMVTDLATIAADISVFSMASARGAHKARDLHRQCTQGAVLSGMGSLI